jgi:hypothetical protein
MGEGLANGAADAAGDAKLVKPEKNSSHTDHRDEFVASEGLTTAGELT